MRYQEINQVMHKAHLLLRSWVERRWLLTVLLTEKELFTAVIQIQRFYIASLHFIRMSLAWKYMWHTQYWWVSILTTVGRFSTFFCKREPISESKSLCMYYYLCLKNYLLLHDKNWTQLRWNTDCDWALWKQHYLF